MTGDPLRDNDMHDRKSIRLCVSTACHLEDIVGKLQLNKAEGETRPR
jgi:hypothetical protein